MGNIERRHLYYKEYRLLVQPDSLILMKNPYVRGSKYSISENKKYCVGLKRMRSKDK